MDAVLPILLLGVAGLLVGGAISLYRQRASRAVVAGVGLLGAVAAVAGVLWLMP